MTNVGSALVFAWALALGAAATCSAGAEVHSFSWGISQQDATHTAAVCKKQGGQVVHNAGGQDVCDIPQPGHTAPSVVHTQDFHFIAHNPAPLSSSSPASQASTSTPNPK